MPSLSLPNISNLASRFLTPYRLGVALSGGGSRGFAHIGALMALEHAGLRPDIIAGVSAGSVVATMYASGIRPMNILDAFKGATFMSLTKIAAGQGGLFKLDKFMGFIRNNVSQQNIEELPLHTVICATDFDHGRPVAFETGRIDRRVAASCCIPIVFRPVKIDGTRYVDGGVLHNLPAWAIRQRCHYLIGINCSPLVEASDNESFAATAMRSYKLVATANVRGDIDMCDLCIETREIAGRRVFDLDNIEDTVKAGYDAAIAALRKAGFPPLGPGDTPPRI